MTNVSLDDIDLSSLRVSILINITYNFILNNR